jgi:hypothetical protein
MTKSFSDGAGVRHEPATVVNALHVTILVSLSLAAIAWGEALIFGSEGVQLRLYLALLAFYAAASALFVMSSVRAGKLQVFEIPVFITVMFFLQFGLLPLRNFIDPAQMNRNLSANGQDLVRALSYCILGMLAFWGGCELVRRRHRGQAALGWGPPAVMLGSPRAGTLAAIVALYALSFGTKFYLLRNQLYSYTGSLDKYYANFASMQVLNYVIQFGTFALVAITIERYRDRCSPLWKALFVVILSSEVLWGMISGMKNLILQNFIAVALVSSVMQRRLNLRWLVFPVLGIILFFPVNTAYRDLLRGRRGSQAVTSVEGAGRATQMALQMATQQGANPGALWATGLANTLDRMDLLTNFAEVLALGPRASFVKGDEPWWMIPVYPFVPRLLWPSKPIELEADRFGIAIGARGSGTAITYQGSLYINFGLFGVPVGMFVLGLVTQWLTNRLNGPMQRQDLFVYAGVFLAGFLLESPVFSVWVGFIKMLAILYALGWAIYGPRRRPRKLKKALLES